MRYYCNICDREVITNPQTHRVCDELVQTHTINRPRISDIKKFMIMLLSTKTNMKFILMRLLLKMNLKPLIFILITFKPLT